MICIYGYTTDIENYFERIAKDMGADEFKVQILFYVYLYI